MTAVRLVYGRPGNILFGLIAFAVMGTFYLWSSQVLAFSGHGVSVLVAPTFIAAAAIMALLFGFLLPLEVYAFRLAVSTTTQTGGTVLGAIAGTTSMTCCAPVILPSVLSLLGFSGTSILGINSTLNRYWVPLATISVILLTYAIMSVIRSLNLECELRLDRRDVAGAGMNKDTLAIR